MKREKYYFALKCIPPSECFLCVEVYYVGFFNDKLNLKNAKKPNSKYNINSVYNEFYLHEKKEDNKDIVVHHLR
jgi:hypothetical protein